MKIIKLFFSRFFIIAMAIIVQFFVFFATNFWLSESYAWVGYWFFALGVVVFFVIINKTKPASFKLPWVVAVLVAPILGITLYLTFGNVNVSKKTRIKIEKENSELQEICRQSEEVMDVLKEESLEAYGQARYIENAGYLPTYRRCYAEYLPDGKAFFDALIDELKKAKRYIFMEYFIIERGQMWNAIHEVLLEKVRQGVEVHLMYDDVGSISKVPNSFVYELRNEGINACRFNPFRPIVSVVHNNRDHRKITVIDGEVGFIGGANIADEYINVTHPFGEWKDNALLMKGRCVDSLIAMFASLYNPHSLKKIDVSSYILSEHSEYDEQGYVAPYADGPMPIYSDYIGMNVYLNIIHQAKRYLYITTPYLIVDYEFLEALITAAKRGVDVRIVTPHIADKKIIKIMTKSNYRHLMDGGVKIYEYQPGFIHAKTFLCDDVYATVGTINVDYRSLVHHFECGVWMYQTGAIADIRKDLADLLERECQLMDAKTARLNPLEKLLKDILRLFAPLM